MFWVQKLLENVILMTYNVSSFQNVDVFSRNVDIVDILGKIPIFIAKITVLNRYKTLERRFLTSVISDLQTLVTFERH